MELAQNLLFIHGVAVEWRKQSSLTSVFVLLFNALKQKRTFFLDYFLFYRFFFLFGDIFHWVLVKFFTHYQNYFSMFHKSQIQSLNWIIFTICFSLAIFMLCWRWCEYWIVVVSDGTTSIELTCPIHIAVCLIVFLYTMRLWHSSSCWNVNCSSSSFARN